MKAWIASMEKTSRGLVRPSPSTATDWPSPRGVRRLVELIEKHGDRPATGFFGTPLLCLVLSRFGRNGIAYRLLLQRKYPSWLYPMLNGATTMWERWNSWREKSGFGGVGMDSFNHNAYSAVGEWMYGAVASSTGSGCRVRVTPE